MTVGKKILLAFSGLCLLSFTLLAFFDTSGRRGADDASNLDPYGGEGWIVAVIPPGGSIFSVLEKNGLPLKEIGLVSFHFGNFVDVTTIQP
ncbi:MAG: M23 family peptidase, partial [Candidatus Syntrophosphaera sp.]|nr:M23 family peptidase [Candidatus Syntrophosphaera sp.]